jgi:RND family efflux transporter MFP subunit
VSDEKQADALEALRIDRGTPTRRRRGWIKGGIAIVLVAVLIALALGPMRSTLFPTRVRTAIVTRVTATQGAVRTTASGYVVARRRAAISSRLSGRLETLLVDVGDRVEEGQLLGRLGQEDLVAAVAEARAAHAKAQLEIPTLERRSDVAAAAVRTAESRLKQVEAAIATAQDRLEEAERVLALEERLLADGSSSPDVVDSSRADRDVKATELTVAQAAVESARAEVAERRQDEGVLRAQIDAARAGVEAAAAAVARAEALRADADIHAPFTGVVLRKEAEVGEMVAPVNAAGSTTRGAIVTLADFASLEMEVDVIERDIGKVAEGLPCRIVLDSRDEPYAGHVRQVVPTADRTRGTVQVKVSFDALDDHVLPEMSGRVEFLEEGRDDVVLGADRVLIDERALVAVPDNWQVWVVRDGTLHRTSLVLRDGEAVNGRREVVSGVKGGEEVVVSPGAKLTDGMSVVVRAARAGRAGPRRRRR